jgi:CPA2 family monovalent cation:H+ antiporter-2
MLGAIVITLLLSSLLNILFKKIHLPTIIGYIATGAVLGYAANMSQALDSVQIQDVAEFGVVFLMFTIGLEFSLAHLKEMKKEVFLFGSLQVLVTTGLIAFLSHHYFNLEIKAGIVIGCALSLASTAIILKLFNETGETNTTYGKNIVGILIFQDLAVIPILLMITVFSADVSESVGSLLYKTVLGGLFLLIIMWAVGKYLLNPFFKHTVQTQSQEILLGSILCIVLGASYIAHYLGLSYSLGAFIAGMLIAETNYKHQVEADLIPFRELLLGLFFVTVGLQLDFKVIIDNIKTILLILPTIMLVKAFIVGGILFKQKAHNIIKTGLALLGLGEFGLVIVDIAHTNKIINLHTSQTLSATIILSLVLTPFIVNNLQTLMNLIKEYILKKETRISPEAFQAFNNHIVLIGFGRLGHHIAKNLKNRNIEYVIIEGNEIKFNYGKQDNEPIIFGNATQTNILHAANIKKARSVFVSVGNSRKTVNICTAIRQMNENIKIIIKVHTHEEQQMLEKEFLHNIAVVVETEETAKIMLVTAKNMLATDQD